MYLVGLSESTTRRFLPGALVSAWSCAALPRTRFLDRGAEFEDFSPDILFTEVYLAFTGLIDGMFEVMVGKAVPKKCPHICMVGQVRGSDHRFTKLTRMV